MWREWPNPGKRVIPALHKYRHWPSSRAKNAAIMSKRRDPVKINITQLKKCVLPLLDASAITLHQGPSAPVRARRLIAAALDDNGTQQ